MPEPLDFRDEHHSAEERVQQQRSDPSHPSHQSVQQHPTDLNSIFLHLEENIVTFVTNELKKFHKVLSPGYPECLEKQIEEEELLDSEDEEQRKSIREVFLKS